MIFIMVEIGYYNKFQLLRIKIQEAFNNIDILFEKKLSLLERSIPIIKSVNEKYKEAPLLDNLIKVKNQKIDRFGLNKELTLALREYHSILDLDKSLSELDSLKKINEDLIDIDNDLNAAKKYYNDNVVLHNNLVRCFPSSIVARLFDYQKQEFFKEEKIETLEILKEK